MSEYFDTVKVTTPEISNCVDKLVYAVQCGPADQSMNVFKANSVSNSNINWSINLPPNVVMDRKVYAQATMDFTIQIGNIANGAGATVVGGDAIENGDLAFKYGQCCSLQSFPFNNMIQTGTLTINNASMSTQVASILPILMRTMKSHHLAEADGDTPVLSDRFYCNFDDMNGSLNNIMSDYGSNVFADKYLSPRGEFPIQILSIDHVMQATNADDEGAALVVTRNNSLIAAGSNRGEAWTLQCRVTVREPLFLAPLLFEGYQSHNSAGIYNIQTLAINLAMTNSLNRFWSTMSTAFQPGPMTVIPNANMFSNVNLFVKLLTVQPSDAVSMPIRNVLPSMNYVSYLTTSNQVCPGVVNKVWPQPVSLQTVTMSLGIIPNLIYIVARQPLGNQQITDATSFFTINSCLVQFANKTSLSNYTSYDLYQLSVKNGLENCSFREWSGQASNIWEEEYPAAGADIANGGRLWSNALKVACSGSILILNPVDLGIADYLTAGSSSAQTLQITLGVVNNSNQNITPEVLVLCADATILVTEGNQSATYSGLLSADIVLDTKSQSTEIPSDSVKEEVGGSMSNKNPLASRHMHRRHKKHGGAMSAGASTAMSAGASHHHHPGNRLKKYFV